MKTILAPTNFSAVSVNAVYYAADMAMVAGTTLTLMHVYPVPLTYSEVPLPVGYIEMAEEEAKNELNMLRDKVSNHTAGRLTIHTVIKPGDPYAGIETFCREHNPYAVVLGSENAGAAERFLFGGSTVKTVKHLSWPVIVVPHLIRFRDIRKIGLACDFRNVIDTIPKKEIQEIVEKFGAELHIIHINTEKNEVFRRNVNQESAWLHEILKEYKPSYHFIDDGDIEKGIMNFAIDKKLDLLIIIPKKHTFPSSIFHHSFSGSIVLHPPVPLMTIHE